MITPTEQAERLAEALRAIQHQTVSLHTSISDWKYTVFKCKFIANQALSEYEAGVKGD